MTPRVHSLFRRGAGAALAAITVATVVTATSQTAGAAAPAPTVSYEFDGTLTDSASGSTLRTAPICPVAANAPCNTTSSFGNDANGSFWAWNSTGNRGGGFAVGTTAPLGTTYTMALKFSLSTVAPGVNGYAKLVDYKNRLSDDGFYFHFGKLKFFPGSSTSAQVYRANQVLDLITVRQATGANSGTFTVYMVGADKRLTLLFTYDDLNGGSLPELLGGGNRLGFFFDDDQSGATNFEAAPSGRAYSLQLWANRALTASEVEEVVLPPEAPVGIATTPGDAHISTTWEPVTSATEYTATASPGGATCTSIAPTTTCDLTGLTNGQPYTVTVVASSANGSSAPSAPSVATPLTVPGTPTSLEAEPGDGVATIAFAEPTDGGSPITNYEYRLDGGTWTPFAPAELNAPVTVKGLTNGVTYSVTLRAVNAVGVGAESAPVSISPVPGPTPPSPPTNLVGVPGNGEATVSFTPGSDGGSPLTNYEFSVDGGLNWTAFGPVDTASPVTITGLTNGTTYEVLLRSTNALGVGEASEAALVTPLTVPGAPSGLEGDASDGTAEISFTAPEDGGSAITGFEYRVDGGIWVPFAPAITSSPGQVQGLTNNVTVSVEVRAVNAAGPGPASEPISITPAARGVTPAWSDQTLSTPRINRSYTDGVAATGTGPIAYTVTAGRLPAGLSLNPTTGAITGRPTTAGSTLFIITAANTYGSITQGFGIVIASAPRTGVKGAVSFFGTTGRPTINGRETLDRLGAAVPRGARNVRVQITGWAEAKRTTIAVTQLASRRVTVTTTELKRRGVVGLYSGRVGGRYPTPGRIGRRSEIVITWDS